MKPTRLLLVILTLEMIFYQLKASEPKVDEDHLDVEPDCGKIPKSAKRRISNAGPSKQVKKVGDNSNTRTKARLINAKISTQYYPWMALIHAKKYYNPQFDPKNKVFVETAAAGSIITMNSIVTVGHTLCIDEFRAHQHTSPAEILLVTCPQNAGEANMNLNIQHKTEIAILVGDRMPQLFPIIFDKNIEAYIYIIMKKEACFILVNTATSVW